MAASNATPLSGLARRLVKDGILDENLAQQSYQDAAAEKVPFVSYLVRQEHADGHKIAEAASDEFGTPYFDLTTITFVFGCADGNVGWEILNCVYDRDSAPSMLQFTPLSF